LGGTRPCLPLARLGGCEVDHTGDAVPATGEDLGHEQKGRNREQAQHHHRDHDEIPFGLDRLEPVSADIRHRRRRWCVSAGPQASVSLLHGFSDGPVRRRRWRGIALLDPFSMPKAPPEETSCLILDVTMLAFSTTSPTDSALLSSQPVGCGCAWAASGHAPKSRPSHPSPSKPRCEQPIVVWAVRRRRPHLFCRCKRRLLTNIVAKVWRLDPNRTSQITPL
jgi:hypothetical protein